MLVANAWPMNFGYRRIVALLAGGVFLLGVAGCAPSQVTHHSGQIGRFYGAGVSFSVPMTVRADKPEAEDSFWEVRTGIGEAAVVALSPPEGRGDGFRENMTLTVCSLSQPVTAEQFRTEQLASLKEAGVLQGEAELGQEITANASFAGMQDNHKVLCNAWFFVNPQGDKGYVLLGTSAEGNAHQRYAADFANIAATLRFGPPPTGFALLGEVADQVGALAQTATATPPTGVGPATSAPEASPAANSASPASSAASPSSADNGSPAASAVEATASSPAVQ